MNEDEKQALIEAHLECVRLDIADFTAALQRARIAFAQAGDIIECADLEAIDAEVPTPPDE